MQPLPESEVAAPSEMMAIGDGLMGGKTAILDNTAMLRRVAEGEEVEGSTKRALARHRQRPNVVFCDGHVATEKSDPGSLDQNLPGQLVGRLRPEVLVVP